jgi:hypothetical protein
MLCMSLWIDIWAVGCRLVCILLRLYSDTSADEDIFVPESHSLAEAAYVIRRLTSRCLERKQPSRVDRSPLCDVVSSFLCHTHIDGKDKLLEWPDRSCLLLYVGAHIH